MQITIPPSDTKQFAKPSRGELFGNLWATKNIDLSANKGKIRLADRPYVLYSTTQNVNFELPVQFIRTDADKTDRWWTLCNEGGISINNGVMFKTTNTNPIVGWTQDAIINTPIDAVDNMIIFGQANFYDRLVVARDTDLAMLNNGTWTASWWDTTLAQNALTATNPHYIYQFMNMILVPDGNVLHTIDDSLVVVASRITLPKEYQIVWIADDGSRVFLGTKNRRGGEGYVFPWDGTSKTYDAPMKIGASMSYGGVSKGGIMHIVNNKGQLMADNGKDFAEVARFPITDTNLAWDNDLTRPLMINPNGIKYHDNKIFILLHAGAGGASGVMDNFPSGLWIYDEEIGLYGAQTIGKYAGSVDIDWGASNLYLVGALTFTDIELGKYLIGAGIYINNLGSKPCIVVSKMGNTTGQRGYIITPQIQADSVRAFWQRLVANFKKLENSTDRIIIKYKMEKESGFNNFSSYIITWDTVNSFTSTEDLSGVEVGDEVEVLWGWGEGLLAHITGIMFATPTYTIGIDETIDGVALTGTARVRIRKFKKLGTVSSQSIQRKFLRIAKMSTWIQFKVELRGTESSPELEKIIISLLDPDT